MSVSRALEFTEVSETLLKAESETQKRGPEYLQGWYKVYFRNSNSLQQRTSQFCLDLVTYSKDLFRIIGLGWGKGQ